MSASLRSKFEILCHMQDLILNLEYHGKAYDGSWESLANQEYFLNIKPILLELASYLDLSKENIFCYNTIETKYKFLSTLFNLILEGKQLSIKRHINTVTGEDFDFNQYNKKFYEIEKQIVADLEGSTGFLFGSDCLAITPTGYQIVTLVIDT